MSDIAKIKFFNNVSRLILTLLVVTSLYILLFVSQMHMTSCDSADNFISAYNSVPLMIESVLAGVAVYLTFAFAAAKIHKNNLHVGG